MAALGGFKVPDFLHFCWRFKKPSHFQKAGKVLVSSPV
jgi:hypothetical protein